MTTRIGAEFRSLRDAAALLGGALALGLLAMTGPVTAFDDGVVELAQTARVGWLTGFSQVVVIAASVLPAALIPLGAALGLAWRRRGSAVRPALTVVLGGWAIAVMLRALLDRPRPPSQLSIQVTSGSYPCVQVAFATGCALVAVGLVGRRYRSRVLATGVVAVGLIGTSSLYLGVYYLTDVVGAVLVSAAVAVLVNASRTGVGADRLATGSGRSRPSLGAPRDARTE